jgi:predicted DNA binding CopG/RHH family protein
MNYKTREETFTKKTESESEYTARSKRITVRFSEEELRRLEKLAGQTHMKISTFLRGAVLKHKIVSKTDMDTIRELKKIGVNLNQIARHMNQEGRVVGEEKLKTILQALVKQIKDLKQQK